MASTDTFIIPPQPTPIQQETQTTPDKKSQKGKWAILIVLVILIITLPVGIYFISQQQQQVTETRSQAGEVYPCHFNGTGTFQADHGCTGKCGPGICSQSECLGKKGSDGTTCCNWMASNASSCTSSENGTAVSKSGTFTKYGQNCDYVSNRDLSREANATGGSCNSTNCGGDCGRYTFNCGVYCFSVSCGSAACAAISDAEKSAPADPTATPQPTATTAPTAAPTSVPNSGKCDASCDSDSNCESGLTCSSVNGVNRCRNASCAAESSCSCPGATATPEPPNHTTGQPMPVSGIGPGIIGSASVVGSILLLVAGLAL